jgi:hypothetical protein
MNNIKTTILTFISLLLMTFSYGQSYGNEWINFSQTYYKVKVFNNGIHRITKDNLESSGINLNNPNKLQLFNNGVEQPIYVNTNNGSVEYIEFYGEKNDGRLDVSLYNTPSNQLNPYYSLYSDTSVYFLTNGSSTGLRYDNINTNLVNLPIKESSFTQEDIISLNQTWNTGTKYNIAGISFNKSFYELGEGWGSHESAQFEYEYVLNTSIRNQSVEVEMNVVYVGNTMHNPTIMVNDNVVFNEMYNGETTKTIRFITQMSSNIFNISLTGIGEKYIIGYIKIKYQKDYDFNYNSTYTFNVNSHNQRKFLEITNFKNVNNSQEIYLYDLTSKKRIHCFWGNSKVLTDLTPSSDVKKLVLVNSSDNNSYITTLKIDEVRFTDYSNYNGDLLIIKHKQVQNYEGRDLIIEYAAHKSSMGFNPVVIDIEEVINQFGYGINNHPQSIRNLFDFVNQNWDEVKYVFLIGKGRNYNEVRNFNTYDNIIPTFGHPASDNLFFSSNGNLTPVSIGRLSVSNSEQFKNYFDKLVEMETMKTNTFENKIIHLIGGNNPNEQLMFRNATMTMETTATDMGYNVTPFSNIIETDNNIYDEINSGSALMTYLGHANPMSLEYEGDSLGAYNNKSKYPFFISLSCKNGSYFSEGEQMSETFVLAQNKGFIGQLGFTTDVSLFGAIAISNQIYTQLNTTNLSVGEMFKNTITDLQPMMNGNILLELAVHSLVLHGDPTYQIKKREFLDNEVTEEPNKPFESKESTQLLTEPEIFNYPNPVINGTRFNISLDESFSNTTEISVEIYDVKGQLVKRLTNDFFTNSGDGTFTSNNWDVMDDLGRSLVVGVYFYNVKAIDNMGNLKVFTPKSNIKVVK